MNAVQYHLLLVDDEGDYLLMTKLLLELEGFRVSTAPGGEQALAMLRDGHRPDLVLLDHRMPGLTGSETLARMRAGGLAAPAALVSARSDVEEAAAADGFDGALAKPFAIEELLLLVRRLLEGRRAE